MIEKSNTIQDNTVNEKKYICNSKHRRKKPKYDRTIWLVSEEKEKLFFWKAVEKKYICNKNFYWWVDITQNTNTKTIMGRTDTNYAYIGKFVSNHNNEWHGYPVTAERVPEDLPHVTILNKWKKLDYFSKKEIANLIRGRGYVKSCT